VQKKYAELEPNRTRERENPNRKEPFLREESFCVYDTTVCYPPFAR